jgi:uncharacterized membrane protein YqgA involved in biofilm formation
LARVIGTILNAAGIVAGGMVGLTLRKQPSAPTQVGIKTALGVTTGLVGLHLTWISLSGGLGGSLKQLGIAVIAMILGRMLGRLLRIQKGMNRLGQYARDQFAEAAPANAARFSDGFVTCTVLFCAAPLSILGAVQDGLDGHWGALGVKACIDGLAAMAFMPVFGWGAILSVIPVFAFQGTITLAVRLLSPFASERGLIDPIHVVGGLLVFCVALLVLEVRRIEVGDYLPSLLVAPILAWIWR